MKRTPEQQALADECHRKNDELMNRWRELDAQGKGETPEALQLLRDSNDELKKLIAITPQ